jgi:hypothetical protein
MVEGRRRYGTVNTAGEADYDFFHDFFTAPSEQIKPQVEGLHTQAIL